MASDVNESLEELKTSVNQSNGLLRMVQSSLMQGISVSEGLKASMMKIGDFNKGKMLTTLEKVTELPGRFDKVLGTFGQFIERGLGANTKAFLEVIGEITALGLDSSPFLLLTRQMNNTMGMSLEAQTKSLTQLMNLRDLTEANPEILASILAANSKMFEEHAGIYGPEFVKNLQAATTSIAAELGGGGEMLQPLLKMINPFLQTTPEGMGLRAMWDMPINISEMGVPEMIKMISGLSRKMEEKGIFSGDPGQKALARTVVGKQLGFGPADFVILDKLFAQTKSTFEVLEQGLLGSSSPLFSSNKQGKDLRKLLGITKDVAHLDALGVQEVLESVASKLTKMGVFDETSVTGDANESLLRAAGLTGEQLVMFELFSKDMAGGSRALSQALRVSNPFVVEDTKGGDLRALMGLKRDIGQQDQEALLKLMSDLPTQMKNLGVFDTSNLKGQGIKANMIDLGISPEDILVFERMSKSTTSLEKILLVAAKSMKEFQKKQDVERMLSTIMNRVTNAFGDIWAPSLALLTDKFQPLSKGIGKLADIVSNWIQTFLTNQTTKLLDYVASLEEVKKGETLSGFGKLEAWLNQFGVQVGVVLEVIKYAAQGFFQFVTSGGLMDVFKVVKLAFLEFQAALPSLMNNAWDNLVIALGVAWEKLKIVLLRVSAGFVALLDKVLSNILAIAIKVWGVMNPIAYGASTAIGSFPFVPKGASLDYVADVILGGDYYGDENDDGTITPHKSKHGGYNQRAREAAIKLEARIEAEVKKAPPVYGERIVSSEESWLRWQKEQAQTKLDQSWEKSFDGSDMKAYYEENRANIIWQKDKWDDLMKNGIIVQDDV